MPQTKITFFIVALMCAAGMGYYGWKQQKSALIGLEQAKSQGAKIDFFLYSRPLFALDSSHKKILLIDANTTTAIDFKEIAFIKFIETATTTQDNSDPTGPDTISIELHNKERYRIGDLRITAEKAIKQFRTFAPEVESIIRKRR
ncbi:MAG: hypothetical protein KGV50_05235 [Gammaproteobacteria bacterium]|nr:hypothetical protein [Gammaproteobacteria bacterium]